MKSPETGPLQCIGNADQILEIEPRMAELALLTTIRAYNNDNSNINVTDFKDSKFYGVVEANAPCRLDLIILNS